MMFNPVAGIDSVPPLPTATLVLETAATRTPGITTHHDPLGLRIGCDVGIGGELLQTEGNAAPALA